MAFMRLQATLAAPEPEVAAVTTQVAAAAAKPRKPATHELRWVAGGWHMVPKSCRVGSSKR